MILCPKIPQKNLRAAVSILIWGWSVPALLVLFLFGISFAHHSFLRIDLIENIPNLIFCLFGLYAWYALACLNAVWINNNSVAMYQPLGGLIIGLIAWLGLSRIFEVVMMLVFCFPMIVFVIYLLYWNFKTKKHL